MLSFSIFVVSTFRLFAQPYVNYHYLLFTSDYYVTMLPLSYLQRDDLRLSYHVIYICSCVIGCGSINSIATQFNQHTI